MIALLFLLATFTPTNPTVGDLITIDFSSPMTVQRSPDYEIVSQSPARVVIRTFRPGPLVVHSTDGEVVIPIQSVLAADDDLKPAPLRPPQELPRSWTPWIAIAIALLCAALAWTLVMLHRAKQVIAPVVPLDERFRKAVRDAATWAALADTMREYLASIHPELGLELTTEELLARTEIASALRPILRQGDLEKFSPWGAEPADFDAAVESALELVA